MSKRAAVINLTGEQEHVLTHMVQTGGQGTMAERVRIVLLAGEGRTTREIAGMLKVRPATVSKWRQRFAAHGMVGLDDAFRSGRPRRYSTGIAHRALGRLNETPPPGCRAWTAELLAQSLGVSCHQVFRILGGLGISLRKQGSCWISTAPEFSAKAIRIVGLYLDPPQNTLVISVHEPAHVGAEQAARGWMRLPNCGELARLVQAREPGREMTLVSGLEAALAHGGRDRQPSGSRRGLGAFLQAIVASHPDSDLFAIVQGLERCDGSIDGWLPCHDRLTLHYTTGHFDWLRDVEFWLRILQRGSSRERASIRAVVEAMDRFVHRATTLPFEWRAAVAPPAPAKVEICG